MQQIRTMGLKLSAVAVLVFGSFCATAANTHGDILRKSFPYGLIGSDFSILNINDLKINACRGIEKPFTGEISGYQYWQCYPVLGSNFSCKRTEHDPDEKEVLSYMTLTAKKKSQTHVYVATRAISLKDCESFKTDFKRLTRNQSHLCVSGIHTDTEKGQQAGHEHLWVFDRLKTRRGCVSYSFGGCDWSYQLKNGCKEKTSGSNSKKL